MHKAPRPPREKYEPPVVRKVKLVASGAVKIDGHRITGNARRLVLHPLLAA